MTGNHNKKFNLCNIGCLLRAKDSHRYENNSSTFKAWPNMKCRHGLNLSTHLFLKPHGHGTYLYFHFLSLMETGHIYIFIF